MVNKVNIEIANKVIGKVDAYLVELRKTNATYILQNKSGKYDKNGNFRPSIKRNPCISAIEAEIMYAKVARAYLLKIADPDVLALIRVDDSVASIVRKIPVDAAAFKMYRQRQLGA